MGQGGLEVTRKLANPVQPQIRSCALDLYRSCSYQFQQEEGPALSLHQKATLEPCHSCCDSSSACKHPAPLLCVPAVLSQPHLRASSRPSFHSRGYMAGDLMRGCSSPILRVSILPQTYCYYHGLRIIFVLLNLIMSVPQKYKQSFLILQTMLLSSTEIN